MTVWPGTKGNLPIHPLCVILSPAPILLRPLFTVLSMIEDQKWEIGWSWSMGLYPDEGSCTEPSDPPEFRRLLDLRIEF